MPIIVDPGDAEDVTDETDVSEGLTGINDVRERCTEAEDVSDEVIEDEIIKAQQLIERYCRQWFDARDLTLTLDGNESDTLFLPVPIISVTSLTINEDGLALGSDNYKAYNSRTIPDDRRNPRIQIKRVRNSIFETGRGRLFVKGLDQVVVGTFGFVEPDGTAPAIVRNACLQLVCSSITEIVTGEPKQIPSGPVRRIETELHEVEYVEGKVAASMFHLFDQRIKNALDLYKAPLGIGAPVTIG